MLRWRCSFIARRKEAPVEYSPSAQAGRWRSASPSLPPGRQEIDPRQGLPGQVGALEVERPLQRLGREEEEPRPLRLVAVREAAQNLSPSRRDLDGPRSGSGWGRRRRQIAFGLVALFPVEREIPHEEHRVDVRHCDLPPFSGFALGPGHHEVEVRACGIEVAREPLETGPVGQEDDEARLYGRHRRVRGFCKRWTRAGHYATRGLESTADRSARFTVSTRVAMLRRE